VSALSSAWRGRTRRDAVPSGARRPSRLGSASILARRVDVPRATRWTGCTSTPSLRSPASILPRVLPLLIVNDGIRETLLPRTRSVYETDHSPRSGSDADSRSQRSGCSRTWSVRGRGSTHSAVRRRRLHRRRGRKGDPVTQTGYHDRRGPGPTVLCHASCKTVTHPRITRPAHVPALALVESGRVEK
jgi:hypothetical protein